MSELFARDLLEQGLQKAFKQIDLTQEGGEGEDHDEEGNGEGEQDKYPNGGQNDGAE